MTIDKTILDNKPIPIIKLKINSKGTFSIKEKIKAALPPIIQEIDKEIILPIKNVHYL